MSTREWLMLLVSLEGAPDGLDPVRIQNGMFLFAMTAGCPEESKYRFHPCNYGPMSPDLYDDLDVLVRQGFVEARSVPGRHWSRYRATPLGFREGAELLRRARQERRLADARLLHQLKSLVAALSFTQLFDEVYDSYPEYSQLGLPARVVGGNRLRQQRTPLHFALGGEGAPLTVVRDADCRAPMRILGAEPEMARWARRRIPAGVRPMGIDLEIARREARTRLIIPNADEIAVTFFEEDLSSVDPARPISYDERALQPWDLCAFNSDDAAIIKRGMRLSWAPDTLWEWLVNQAPIEALDPIDPEWDVGALEGQEWDQARARVEAALVAFIQDEAGEYRALATVTKIMHLKRPALIPILDRNVRAMLGVRLGDGAVKNSQVQKGLLGLDLMRQAVWDNRDELTAIKLLLAQRGKERSLSRILDAILWKIY